jgi:hypothetical protein
MTTTAKPKASFGVTKKNSPGVMVRAKAMYTAILAAVSMFPSPTVTMVVFLALIQAMETAQQASTNRGKGQAATRNAKRDDLWTAMVSLKAYVQGLADAVAHAEAVALIQAGGLLVARVQAHQKAILQAKLTTTPGVIQLIANAKILLGGKGRTKKSHFLWQYSADGGKTWITAPSTSYATTEIAGLTLMTEYRFRVAVMKGNIAGEWTDEVKLLVH